ncbi:oligo-1,6-glucosidase/alpha-glucosidase [Sphingomonas gellani]|uniref:Oligo-1,6-glucosidase/alpha-glucosidase n=1 Tax=Sphingomonas gellani TaxID=1166340 RepID=A0A1H8GJM8_9SPHN|nr:alpha-amylase family glycosyl hydrolase [Sphingomonas gellani]SEN44009.1 oligo-1,6-glucosidase/alpha-glucosidase [Sphingomonas gellani]
MTEERTPWWRTGSIYQIYPRSFQDTDGDGIGDLAGITQRLDYLVDLGIDAVWISPIFPSPMADFGYDVADYVGIDPRFGTLDDFDRLLAAAHTRGLRVLLDFVPNHSSDRHPWFVESRSSRTNPKRDWYIWRDAKPDGSPPNNWISDFGGPAWEWDAATGQYYSHAFLPQQPDLNWRNPAVVDAMLDAMRFWLERGVDGFRIDVLWHMVKHAEFIDNPLNPDWHAGMGDMHRVHQTHSTDQPEVHDIAARMRALAEAFSTPDCERVLIGEIYLPFERLMQYYGTAEAPGVHLPFNFTLIDAAWNARALAALIAEYEAALPADGWPNWVLGNHDRPRSATKRGAAQARVAQMLLLTLRGTPTLYYGDELGMEDVAIPLGQVQDPRELREPGLGLGRDPVRTPMPWSDAANAGFSTGTPWLPLGPDWRTRNVAAERDDPASMLTLVRALLAMRRAQPALSGGDLRLLEAEGDVLAYTRGDDVLVALNLGSNAQRLSLPTGAFVPLLTSDGTGLDLEWSGGLALKPDQGIILRRIR